MSPISVLRLIAYVGITTFIWGGSSISYCQSSINPRRQNVADSFLRNSIYSYLPDVPRSKAILPPSPRGISKAAATQSPIYVIDTIITLRALETGMNHRFLFTHYPSGKTESETIQDSNNWGWHDWWRREMTYDARGNVDTLVEGTYIDGKWLSQTRYISEYDNENRQLSTVGQQLSDFYGRWVNRRRDSYTYNADGQLATSMLEFGVVDDWRPNSRAFYGYDGNGRLSIVSWQSWDSSGWTPSGRTAYTWDALGRDTSELTQLWEDSLWVNVQRISRTYDTQGNVLSALGSYWTAGAWQDSWLDTYAYDAGLNKPIEFLERSWQQGEWVNAARRRYEYDAKGREVASWYESWGNGQWFPSRQRYSYDGRGNLVEGVAERYLNSTWTLMPGEFTAYDSVGNSYYFYDAGRAFVHWTLMDAREVGGSTITAYALFQNYPNPFNPTTTIRYVVPQRSHAKLDIYNLLGQHVATLLDTEVDAGYHEVEFNGSDQASGVYFYRLQAGDFTQTRKLCLVR